jgi:hypothetical protein
MTVSGRDGAQAVLALGDALEILSIVGAGTDRSGHDY